VTGPVGFATIVGYTALVWFEAVRRWPSETAEPLNSGDTDLSFRRPPGVWGYRRSTERVKCDWAYLTCEAVDSAMVSDGPLWG